MNKNQKYTIKSARGCHDGKGPYKILHECECKPEDKTEIEGLKTYQDIVETHERILSLMEEGVNVVRTTVHRTIEDYTDLH